MNRRPLLRVVTLAVLASATIAASIAGGRQLGYYEGYATGMTEGRDFGLGLLAQWKRDHPPGMWWEEYRPE